MQNLLDLQQKIFFETQTILGTLSKINSIEELLAKQNMVAELADRISFLKVLDKNLDDLKSSNNFSHDSQGLESYKIDAEEQIANDLPQIEEEVLFTTEINNVEEEETTADTIGLAQEEAEKFNEIIEDVEQEVAYEELVAEKQEIETEEQIKTESHRREIIEIDKKPEVIPHNTESQTHVEKKFKLAHIKGLKGMKNLFDEDPLEDLQHPPLNPPAGSVVKSNVPTDFMEAEKRKPEFKLDLNDKVAFTKMLFRGNESELKMTIDKLNSFNNLDDAKAYLSDVYYKRKWDKVDEYAQRLWGLVENKFL